MARIECVLSQAANDASLKEMHTLTDGEVCLEVKFGQFLKVWKQNTSMT